MDCFVGVEGSGLSGVLTNVGLSRSGGNLTCASWCVGVSWMKNSLPCSGASGSFVTVIRRTYCTMDDRAALSMWILMPQGKPYASWLVIRRSDSRGRTDDPKRADVEVVTPIEQFISNDSSIIGFELVGVKGGYTYDIYWTYK